MKRLRSTGWSGSIGAYAPPALSVAILGHAKNLLRSHLADPGDDLVVAVDLEGRAGCRSVVSWDANSGKTPEELRNRLETLPEIADGGLSRAAKDISNAGLIGTAAIMMFSVAPLDGKSRFTTVPESFPLPVFPFTSRA